MKGKKLLVLVVSVLMVLSIPFVIYGYSFSAAAFDRDFYNKEFSKYNVYGNLGEYNVESINGDVLAYLKNGKNNELTENNFFSEREKAHLLDVRNLFQLVLGAFNISIILFLSLSILLIALMGRNFKKIMKRLLIILMFGGFLTLSTGVLLFVLSRFNFDFAFGAFHKIFFIAGTYTFDPGYENIVVLYPQNLFFDILARIISSAILSSAIILFFCTVMLFIFSGMNFSDFFVKNADEKNDK